MTRHWPSAATTTVAGIRSRSIAPCSPGSHPLAFHRTVFPKLAELHGDKGVWRLLDERAGDVVEIRIPGPIPLDVDTPEDYEAVLAAAGFAEVHA